MTDSLTTISLFILAFVLGWHIGGRQPAPPPRPTRPDSLFAASEALYAQHAKDDPRKKGY